MPIYGGLILKVETTSFATLHLEKLQVAEKAAPARSASDITVPLHFTHSP